MLKNCMWLDKLYRLKVFQMRVSGSLVLRDWGLRHLGFEGFGCWKKLGLDGFLSLVKRVSLCLQSGSFFL